MTFDKISIFPALRRSKPGTRKTRYIDERVKVSVLFQLIHNLHICRYIDVSKFYNKLQLFVT